MAAGVPSAHRDVLMLIDSAQCWLASPSFTRLWSCSQASITPPMVGFAVLSCVDPRSEQVSKQSTLPL